LRGISNKNRLSYFLGGLKDEIRLPLQMLNPQTPIAAFGLAKLQEEYITSSKHSYTSTGHSLPYTKQQSWGQSIGTSVLPGTHSSNNLPAQKISPQQMKERRGKGLCYNYDDKWNPAHKCKTPKLFLILGLELPWDEKPEEIFFFYTKDSIEPQIPLMVTNPIDPEISLNAISGSLSLRTKCLEGWVKNQRVVILIDSSSTHNFLDPSILKKIQVGVI
jgi:hypothetical protein